MPKPKPLLKSVSTPRVLVTGGAGFIGSHTCVALVAAGYLPVVLDTLANSDARSLQRVACITGVEPVLVRGDVRDAAALDRVLAAHRHRRRRAPRGVEGGRRFGGRPGELLRRQPGRHAGAGAGHGPRGRAHAGVFFVGHGVWRRAALPHCRDRTVRAVNPYGRTKAMVEQLLADLAQSDARWGIACLRYFNPIGAHETGLLGERPHGTPNNLMPYISQVAAGEREHLVVHGADYDTVDGTGVRDYVHVMDVAEGHVAALRHVARQPGIGMTNLGTGHGASVLQVVNAFERASGRRIALRIGPRRPGDAPAYWADAGKAYARFGWRARRSLDQMCADCWRWQATNPHGFDDPVRQPVTATNAATAGSAPAFAAAAPLFLNSNLGHTNA
jgi:UDP-glucose 4-epimerase